MSKEQADKEIDVRKEINYLVQQSKAGSLQASEELLSRLKPLIFATIKRNISNNAPDWEDLLQEANLSILEGIRDYDEEKEIPFLAYIKTKLKFNIYNLCRSERTRGSRIIEADKEGQDPLDFIPDDTANPSEELLKKEQTVIIQDALSKLEPKYREVIVLYFFKKLTLKEAAGKMGISCKTVQRYKAKAIDKLAGLMGEEL